MFVMQTSNGETEYWEPFLKEGEGKKGTHTEDVPDEVHEGRGGV